MAAARQAAAAVAAAAATDTERASRGRLGVAAGIAAAGLGAALALAGCGSSGDDPAASPQSVEHYVARVEPIRLGVNRLLDRADPILSAYREHQLGPNRARARLDALERRFAAFAVKIAALRRVPRALREAQRAYAHTYVLEDAYLSALTAAIPERDFDQLPDTQAQQRAAIIAWRIRLQLVARRVGGRLPSDIQVAGRGEIAPSPLGD